MSLYKKILIPIDNSEESWQALIEGLKLAADKGTWIIIATVSPVYPAEVLFAGAADPKEKVIAPYKELLNKAKKVVEEKGLLAKTVLEEGDEPFERIVDIAYADNCDLIVMGKGGSKLKRIFLGSTTARVIGYSPVDVLVIPLGKKLGWEKILAAVDGSSYSERAFEKALTLAKDNESELILLSVVDYPPEYFAEAPQVIEKELSKRSEYLAKLEERCKKEGVKARKFLKEGSAEDKILETAEETSSQLIVMGTYGRKGIKRLLMGSTTERVLSEGICPVLVVK
jgi:nucleotide-binding universal stress UspA family protein